MLCACAPLYIYTDICIVSLALHITLLDSVMVARDTEAFSIPTQAPTRYSNPLFPTHSALETSHSFNALNSSHRERETCWMCVTRATLKQDVAFIFTGNIKKKGRFMAVEEKNTENLS